MQALLLFWDQSYFGIKFMKYTLLVVLTDDNSNYKTKLEKYLSKVECIDEIRYLNLNSQKSLKGSCFDEDSKTQVKVSIKSLTFNSTLIAKLQSSVEDLNDKYLMVLPQTLLPSLKFFEYAKNALDENTGALILGLHDNKVVTKDELLSPKENYKLYTVYNKKPSEHDLENCVLCRAELIKDISNKINCNFVTQVLYQSLLAKGQKVAFAVNERLCFDKGRAKEISKKFYPQDLKTAKKLGIVPTVKLSLLEKLFSIKKFNGRTQYTLLGQSVSVKFKKLPVFPENAIEVQEKVTDLEKIDYKHKRACLFASFTKDGLVSENTLNYLKSLREFCDVIVYVADSKALPETVEKLKEHCDYIIIKRHQEYDFGSYKRGYQYLLDNKVLDKVDSLLICNDSVDFVGNSEDLKEIFTKAKDSDAYAMCMATYGFGKKIKKHKYEWTKNPHLQSYFLVLDKKIFSSNYFAKFILGIKRIKSKTEIIKKYEMGLSEMLRAHQVKMDSFYPYDDTNIVNPYAIYLNQFVSRPILVKHMLSK